MAILLDGSTPINGYSSASSVEYDNAESGLDATTTQDAIDELVNDLPPFKFGITDDGQYGYYKDGADTVTPFKTGSGGGNILHLYTASTSETLYDCFTKGMSIIYLFCDALFKETISLSDLVVPSYITNAEYYSRNLVKLTVDSDAAKLNPTITIKVKSSGLKFNNGDVFKTFDIKSSISVFFNTTDELTVWKNTLSDNDTFTLNFDDNFKILTCRYMLPDSTSDTYYDDSRYAASFFCNSDSYSGLIPGGETYASSCTFNFMYQDNAAYYLAYAKLVDLDDVGKALKYRYKGDPWRDRDNGKILEYELFMLENGDYFINILDYTKSSSYIGDWKFNKENITVPNEGASTISFYRKDYMGTNYDIVYESYNINNHHTYADSISPNYTLSELINGENNNYSWVSKEGGDTYSTNFSFDFLFNGSKKISFNGDSAIKTSDNKTFKYNYRDGLTINAKIVNATLTDLNNIKCCKIIHNWYPMYNVKTEEERQLCEIYFFSNGDVMLKCIKSANTQNNGQYSCFGKDYVAFTTGDVISFYRKDADGNDWDIIKETYNIEHHNNF